MDDQNKLRYLQKYRIARNEYRTIAINQLSFANNLLLTLSVGFLALGVDKEEFQALSLSPRDTFSCTKLFLILFTISTVLSILWGVLVIFSRLYDFRITRYILTVRMKIMAKHETQLGYPILRETNREDRWRSFYVMWNKKIKKFSKNDIDKFNPNDDSQNGFEAKFIELRETAQDLGEASINWVKCQVITFFIGVICFVLHLLFL